MQRSWRGLLPLVILALVVGYLYLQRTGMPGVPVQPANTAPGATTGTMQANDALPGFLPPEARRTLALIARGGPFPNHEDGVVFGNYEHLLPSEPRGYYHEYTVATPGARNRGARRVITGGNPPSVYYYTDDHYRSFREFKVPR